jgi:hypothetical protein
MSMVKRVSSLFESLTAANHYNYLFQMSDNELAARGLSRDALARSYISGIGAH